MWATWGRIFLWILIFPVPLQVLQLWHRAQCLQEAGPGSGCRVEGQLRVPGRGRAAAAQGRAPAPRGAGTMLCFTELPSSSIPHPGPAFPTLLAAGGQEGGGEGASPWRWKVCFPSLGCDDAALPSKAALPQIRPGQRDRHQSSQLVLKSGSALALLRREGLGVGARGMCCDGFAC